MPGEGVKDSALRTRITNTEAQRGATCSAHLCSWYESEGVDEALPGLRGPPPHATPETYARELSEQRAVQPCNSLEPQSEKAKSACAATNSRRNQENTIMLCKR